MVAGFGNIPPFYTNYGPASATSPGFLTTGAQTIAGAKTFSGGIVLGTPLPIGSGGTGSATQNFVDLSSTQSAIAGSKTFTSTVTISSGVTGTGLNVVVSGGRALLLLQRTVSSAQSWSVETGASTGLRFVDITGSSTTRMEISTAGLLTTTGGKVRKTRIALTTPVTVAVTDDIVEVNLTTPGAVAINYFATPATGSEVVFQDGKGDAGANNHTHTPAAGNINGAGTKIYATNYYRATAFYNGTQWLIG